MNTNNDQAITTKCCYKPFCFCKIKQKIVEGMISTYEFLEWQNKGSDDAKE
jgi:hypothetical protein